MNDFVATSLARNLARFAEARLIEQSCRAAIRRSRGIAAQSAAGTRCSTH